ncbi:hypothetical protein [Luteibacter sahnii]|uniref:hypothetical protein n=1 Tax=Luteibacter sahnii TaxID=3021977 RepID=UPI002A69A7AE|nr:hypothetical protein [Luteibacter sp. PPL193]MDY1547610.1 hypothetical protein [Luteibacter sp. PPL193]
MRRILACLCAASLTAAAAHAQDLPPPPPAPPGPGAPVQVEQTVQRFIANPNGDVDTLILGDGTQVPVPPPVGNALANERHATLSIHGSRLADAPVIVPDSIREGSRDWLANAPAPVPPAAPPALAPMKASGRVAEVLFGPRGEANGVLLTDGTVVRVPPHAALAQPNLLVKGASFSASGFGVANGGQRALQAVSIGTTPSSEQAITPPPPPPPVTAGQAPMTPPR